MNVLEILKEYNGKVKEDTLKSYARTLDQLKRKCEGDSMFKFLKNPKKVLACLSENHNSRKTAIVAILTLLRLQDVDSDIIDVYKNEQNKSIEAVQQFYKSGEKSEKQSKNWLSIEELNDILLKEEQDYEEIKNKIRGELRPNTYLDTQNYILLKIHLDYPIRNDLADTMIVSHAQFNKFTKAKKNKNNYLVINKSDGKLILNEYKSAEHYGQKSIDLNDELVATLNEWIKWRAKHGYGSQYLLINKYKNAMNPNNITKSFLRLFSRYGKQISTSMIRHIILTEKFGESNKEKEKMADVMGNSSKTIDEKYVKNNDE